MGGGGGGGYIEDAYCIINTLIHYICSYINNMLKFSVMVLIWIYRHYRHHSRSSRVSNGIGK